MKKIYTLLIVLLFNACGGGGSSQQSYTNYQDNTSYQNSSTTNNGLKKGIEYPLYKGDKIIKDSTSARIEIIHQLSTDRTVVKLLSGEAHIE